MGEERKHRKAGQMDEEGEEKKKSGKDRGREYWL